MNSCCEETENREAGPGPRGAEGAPEDVDISHCTVCECRHFEVLLEPGVIGIKGRGL